jgi:hypothetical protein
LDAVLRRPLGAAAAGVRLRMGTLSTAGGIGRIAFLFLGETLLIPHLYPIVEALSDEPGVAIDLWVSTTVHDLLLGGWIAALANPRIRIRRAPGYVTLPEAGAGANPPLPAKLPMLARLLPRLLTADVVVCAEQTSLWAPRLLPLPMAFVKTSHGVGSMSARDDARRRAASLTLTPSERERQTYLARGLPAERVVATGYVKSAFRRRGRPKTLFPAARPTVLYTPHWQRHRSSWWDWGEAVVRDLARSVRYNLIFAPHQRLVRAAPQVREVAAAVAGLPNVHCDLDSFAMVDGSYTAAADIYLGDTSSQVVEFLMTPRPCVFLNPGRVVWREDESYAQWACGEVVEDMGQVVAALDRAAGAHAGFDAAQRAFAASSLGDTSGAAAGRAARQVLEVLARQRRRRGSKAGGRPFPSNAG